MTFGSLGETSMSSRRPPMLAGPMDRNRKLDSTGFDVTLKLASRGAAPRPCAPRTVTQRGSAKSDVPRRRTRRETVCISCILVGGKRWRTEGLDVARWSPADTLVRGDRALG